MICTSPNTQQRCQTGMRSHLWLFTATLLLLQFPARAQLPATNPDVVLEGEFVVHPANRAMFNTPIASEDGRLFVAYIDTTLATVIAMKHAGRWSRHIVEPNTRDDVWHNQPSVAIDPMGYLHVAYNMHSTPWQYSTSGQPFDITDWRFQGQSAGSPPGLSIPPTEVRDDWLGPGKAAIPGNQISYAAFFSDRKGNLYVVFRECSRCEARNYFQRGWAGGIARFNAGEREWQRIGGPGPLAQDPDFVPLGMHLAFDGENRMHLSWVWTRQYDRAKAFETAPSFPAYARSDDGGRSFHSADGTLLPLPLTFERSDKIVNPAWLHTNPGGSFLGYTRVATDRNGNPAVIVLPRAPYARDRGNALVRFEADRGWLPPKRTPGGAERILVDGEKWYAISSGVRLYESADAGRNWQASVIDTAAGGQLVSPDYGWFQRTGRVRFQAMSYRPGASTALLKVWSVHRPLPLGRETN